MRARGSLLILCLVSLGANYAFAQAAEDPPLQFDPYNKHHDRHLGHDHVYPDRGSVFRDAPKGSMVVNYAGLAYRFYNGVWFEPRGPAYIVVMPPIGVVVPTLPGFATSFQSSGETYLYANDTYYLPRPDLGGYEVVNDPADSVQTSAAKAEMRLVKPSPGAAVMPGAVVPAVATVSVAPTPAAPPVPGAQQIANIPTNLEETADAEVKAYSYAPATVSAQPGQNSAANVSAAPKRSEAPAASGAVIAPAMAGAALAAAPAVAGTQAVAAAPVGAGGGSLAAGPAPAVASNATIATTPAVGMPPPAPPVGNNLAVSAPQAAVGAATPQVAGSTITNVPSTAAVAPAPLPTGAGATWSSPPSASESTATTPRPSSAYTYASPPTLQTDPNSGGTTRTANATVATGPTATTATTNAGGVTTVPALASAATTAQFANASTGGAAQTVSNTSNGGGVRFTASPRNGQSLDQQARDQYDCYRFGVAQTGFDPMSSSAPAAGRGSQADFDRARAACFEGRGYNVR